MDCMGSVGEGSCGEPLLQASENIASSSTPNPDISSGALAPASHLVHLLHGFIVHRSRK